MAPNESQAQEHLEKELLLPYTHVIQIASKGLRKRIAEAFNHWLRLPEETMREVVDIIQMYSDCSLILDDIQDNITVRRGLPAAHCVYGVPWAVNTSVHVFMLILLKCCKLGAKAQQTFSEQSLELIRGQGKEIYWRDSFICPTEEEYKAMLQQKTGGMFNLACQLMQIFSDNKTDYSNFAKTLGLYFQLRDDYYNIMQPEACDERPADKVLDDYCMDLTEGKFTLPVIHAAKSSRGAIILNILKQRTTDVNTKRYCVTLLEEVGSLEYTKKTLRDLDSSLRNEIKRFGGNPLMTAVLDMLQLEN
ncbi:geranylgeranyl pyrophosphate synthase-like [Zerene cesonia]|uniref:geranylgeranyl pyrophosphate synthase-like n=1 Tax=Zerene cesonia TaxID=33412 RepID=UPI0018E56716|nr:geranylgeranyl pyrophosphate synthase-like [Zerene cesonia]